jgi:hypothetical protein
MKPVKDAIEHGMLLTRIGGQRQGVDSAFILSATFYDQNTASYCEPHNVKSIISDSVNCSPRARYLRTTHLCK